MLVELAIGDAYGAAFEFAKDDWVSKNNDLKYHVHPSREDDLHEGEYTDDTQMSIAIVNHLLSRSKINQFSIARFFVDEFFQYPIDGYARNFQKFLQKCSDEKDKDRLIKEIVPASSRNGSVMRAVPVGVLPTPEEVINYSIVQSSITHATMPGMNGALAVGLAGHYYYYNLGRPKDIGSYITEIIGMRFQKVTSGPVPCEALHTAFAAINISTYASMKKMLKASIALRGDTDSVASIALGLASLRVDIESDLPDNLYKELSPRNRRNMQELSELDEKLFEEYRR